MCTRGLDKLDQRCRHARPYHHRGDLLFSRAEASAVSTCVRAGSRGAAADHGDGGAAGVRGLRVDRSRRRGRDDRLGSVRTRCGRRPVGRAGGVRDARGAARPLEAARSHDHARGGPAPGVGAQRRDGDRQSRRARGLGRRLSPRSRGSSCGTTIHDAQRRGRVRSSRGWCVGPDGAVSDSGRTRRRARGGHRRSFAAGNRCRRGDEPWRCAEVFDANRRRVPRTRRHVAGRRRRRPAPRGTRPLPNRLHRVFLRLEDRARIRAALPGPSVPDGHRRRGRPRRGSDRHLRGAGEVVPGGVRRLRS